MTSAQYGPGYPAMGGFADDADAFDDRDVNTGAPPNPDDLIESMLQRSSGIDEYKGMSPFYAIASILDRTLATIEDVAASESQPTHDVGRAIQEYARGTQGVPQRRIATPSKLTIYSPYVELAVDPIMLLARDPDRYRTTIRIFGNANGAGGFRLQFGTSASVRPSFNPNQFTFGSDQAPAGGAPLILHYQGELWVVCDSSAPNGAWVQCIIERF